MYQLEKNIDLQDTLLCTNEYKEIKIYKDTHHARKLRSSSLNPDLPDVLEPVNDIYSSNMPKPYMIEEESKNPELSQNNEDYNKEEFINEEKREEDKKEEENNIEEKKDVEDFNEKKVDIDDEKLEELKRLEEEKQKLEEERKILEEKKKFDEEQKKLDEEKRIENQKN